MAPAPGHQDCYCSYLNPTAGPVAAHSDRCPPIRASSFPARLARSDLAAEAVRSWVASAPTGTTKIGFTPVGAGSATSLWVRSAPPARPAVEDLYYAAVAAEARHAGAPDLPDGYLDRATGAVVDAFAGLVAESDTPGLSAEAADRLEERLDRLEKSLPQLVGAAVTEATARVAANEPVAVGSATVDTSTVAADVLALIGPKIMDEIPKAVAVYVERTAPR